ncbi:helix-turn-helix transcriptional regulator [Allocoprobacillus halotolerans]|uniref:Helix-turn-helix transcriptional regulator n=1 Tax=Allocoprobacillus halotolerans TaxID=2944914 RepID=A0ABY5I122_9FIRM|nr:helix-turn-helix transcriptional regulator [Allocoprobacillus halotolerans]UTY39057.1 helix-turn-helix transcriptional regulator [Allocoprobacillus halotolerans]
MPEKTLKRLGNSIREHRKQKGYSQQDLAEITGISRRHIANIENGIANASFEIITILVKELNISLDSIVYIEQLSFQSTMMNSLSIQLSQCTDSQQKIIFKTLKCLMNEFISYNHFENETVKADS